MYCRHCFRKRMVGLSEDELNRRADEAIAYVAKHGEITNVLISGGDALMNPNSVIERYLEACAPSAHRPPRFGSRFTGANLRRRTMELFERYAKRKTLFVVTQFDHPRS
ncbi:MAG: hypothetical protein ACLUEK_07495 [Oscillospiraceae bacterium]